MTIYELLHLEPSRVGRVADESPLTHAPASPSRTTEPDGAAPSAPVRAPRRRDHLTARLRAWQIDADLSEDGVTWRSPAHAARALQLTSDGRRWALARSLDATVERTAEQRRRAAWSAVVPVDRTAVREATPMIVEVSARLRAAGPVHVAGIIEVERLLSDGAGPLYRPTRPGALPDALAHALDALDGRASAPVPA